MPHYIKIDDETFQFIQQRQKRKTISIAIQASKRILIKTPLNVTTEAATQLLQKYSHWIKEKDQSFENLSRCAPINNKYIIYMGEPRYIIRQSLTNTPLISLEKNKIFLNCALGLPIQLAEIFIPWYKGQAKHYLTQRTSLWADRLKVNVAHISIRDQKTRWGSCSTRHNINYNWRIMMAPTAVIEYLVIHEVSHLLQMNHSAKFWQIVESCDPDYHARKLWLKENGTILLHALRP